MPQTNNPPQIDLVELLRGVRSWAGFIEALLIANKYWERESPLQFNGRAFAVLGSRLSHDRALQAYRPLQRLGKSYRRPKKCAFRKMDQ
jgi:hypothetical protein